MTSALPRPGASRRVAPLLFAALFVGAGALHFIRPSLYDSVVPRWAAPGLFPTARSVTLISGAAELAGGLGLLLPITRPAASWGLALLLLAVFPANLDMAQHPEQFGLPTWALWARLPLQPLLIWWVLRAGQVGKRAWSGVNRSDRSEFWSLHPQGARGLEATCKRP